MPTMILRLVAVFCILSLSLIAKAQTIVIGLDADMSSGSAQAGESIRRGALIAINEINASGGVLGHHLELQVMDHRGNPRRGIDNVNSYANNSEVLAILGGLHTPVALRELPSIHEHEIPFLIPWAAGTPVVDNGFKPNYVFRISARDEYVGGFLVERALSQGYERLALLLERTGWGRSNDKAMTEALNVRQSKPATVEWFHWGEQKFDRRLAAIEAAKADAILFVGNAPEGKELIRTMAALPESQRLPIISHWGITGGNFYEDVGHLLEKVDLQFMQTFSFNTDSQSPLIKIFINQYCEQFECDADRPKSESIKAPVGAAHAYDLIHIFKTAIENAGVIDRKLVRDALESLQSHKGLVKHYQPPFTNDQHDALSTADFILAEYSPSGAIVPR